MLTIEKFKQNLNNTRKPVDVIRVILGYSSEANIFKVPAKIHSAIYTLSRKEEWCEYFKGFYFNTSGITPYSYELDQAIKRLETSCMLSTQNPSYSVYNLERDHLLESLTKFEPSEQIQLQEMSEKFKELLI